MSESKFARAERVSACSAGRVLCPSYQQSSVSSYRKLPDSALYLVTWTVGIDQETGEVFHRDPSILNGRELREALNEDLAFDALR